MEALSPSSQKLAERWIRKRPALQLSLAWYGPDGELWTWEHQSTAQTLFEIGSLTKTYTGALLATLAEQGRVGLDDPISRWLDLEQVSDEALKQITLRQLATHTSGLPRLPKPIFKEMDRADPYAHFGDEDAIDALGGLSFKAPKKAKIRYSNFGMGLLGQVLAAVEGSTWYEALSRQVLEPLGLEDTYQEVPESAGGRLSQGHAARGKPVGHWSFLGLPGAGALRSTATQVARYLQKLSKPEGERFREALKIQVQGSLCAGLGWMMFPPREGQDLLTWHDGATGGFSAFAAFAGSCGVVALANHAPSFWQMVLTQPLTTRIGMLHLYELQEAHSASRSL